MLGITDKSLQHINILEKLRGVANTAIHEIFCILYFDKDATSNDIGSGKELPYKGDINSLIKGFQDNNRIIEIEKIT